jgi:hypothetical protein
MTNLALKLADNARAQGVQSVYGDPIQIDGVTIVPVAIVQYGFGGGGDDSDSAAASSGGGGGGASIPVGAYEKHGNTVRFEPNIISLIAVSIPFVCVTGMALARIIRAAKR